MSYDVKFDKEKECTKKLFKRQLELIEKAQNVDQLDDAIDPVIILRQKIDSLIDTDLDNLTEMYDLISNNDWEAIEKMCKKEMHGGIKK